MAEQIISPGVFQNEVDQSLIQTGVAVAGAALVGPTVTGRPLVPTLVTSYSEYLSVYGDIFQSGSNYYEYFTSLLANQYFSQGGQSLLVTRIVSGSLTANTYASAYIPISGSNVDGLASSSFQIEALAWGSIMNNSGSLGPSGSLMLGTSQNIRWEISNVDYVNGVFTLLVRSGDDNANQENILETWSNLSLDPQQSNFISAVIGDEKAQYNSSNGGYIEYIGNYPNASQYIRISNITNILTNSTDNFGNFLTNLSSSLPNIGSGSLGGAFYGGVAETNRVGYYFENIGSGSTDNVQGFASTDYELGINLLSNQDEYDYNLLLVPGVTLIGGASAAANSIIAVCESRGDAMAIIDCTLYQNPSNTAAVVAASSQNTNYAATYWPWIQIYSSGLGKAIWVPASVLMAGVYAFNDQVSAPWFAPAGLNRGGIGSAVKAQLRLAQSDRDTLYQGNVNPIATFPGTGVVAWGQKTLQKSQTALNRVNVRRLLIALKKFIGGQARNLVFQQNTSATRNSFLNIVNPYLDSIVQRQGLYAYKVTMDTSNNTSDVIDRNQIVGNIQIQPTKTAEFVILNYVITPTGATFS
jgi:phage tail sheath protein FI